METKEIQKLIDFISNSGLDEVNIETADLKLSIKRYSQTAAVAPVVAHAPVAIQAAPVASAAPVTPASAAPEPAAASNLITVKSPMIGTFYRAGGPDKPNFVEIGTEIKGGQVLCIIEAMKLFNEIESEVSGKIVKILVDDATPVEFDQPLFLVEPN
ncbi:MAG: acetyl-CoA carboxylase biotin carboxyl carrier protein [Spirosomataceae bacterium]